MSHMSPLLLGFRAVVLVISLTAGIAHAGDFSNFLGMKFTDIPAGSFQMGSCLASVSMEEDKRRASTGCVGDLDALINEIPQHRVGIQGFQMGKTEVTLGQFKRYIIATGLTELVTDDFMSANPYSDDAPVVQVSWNDAKSFIEWLNLNKAATDHGTYRLPTEAEWEYACRAGGNHTYCGSRSESAVAWHEGNSGRHQQVVGRKNANAFGLYDMSGNVWEWVEDCYHTSYREAPVNGGAWIEGCSNTGHVLRGGSWKTLAKAMRPASRTNLPPVNRGNDVGFRLVRVLP